MVKRTILGTNGPDHLGLWLNGLSSAQMAGITSGCGLIARLAAGAPGESGPREAPVLTRAAKFLPLHSLLPPLNLPAVPCVSLCPPLSLPSPPLCPSPLSPRAQSPPAYSWHVFGRSDWRRRRRRCGQCRWLGCRMALSGWRSHRQLAAGQISVILLTPPFHPHRNAWVQQNDSFADGCRQLHNM